MEKWRKMTAGLVAQSLAGIAAEEIEAMLEYPPEEEMGDLSLPCFKLSKQLRKPPQEIAQELKQRLECRLGEQSREQSGEQPKNSWRNSRINSRPLRMRRISFTRTLTFPRSRALRQARAI
ncbi:hypothetical protein HMSSN036_64850 [Paenibacillus macerans]|nr:hypothetical protein HMSSN036_64850 [Paenibacillus macerans]